MAIYTITRKNIHESEGLNLAGRISLPSSKSISNRLLIIRALARSDFQLENLSDAEDTLLLQELLQQIESAQPNQPVLLNCCNAGTVIRFLAAYLTIQPGTWLLCGSDRMHKRPIGILVEALRSLGAVIDYTGIPGYPPLRITGKALQGGEVNVDASVSSQFVSALLLMAPLMPGGLTVHLVGDQVSYPYVDMTIRIMEEFGIVVGRVGASLVVHPGQYVPAKLKTNSYTVEADWSSAAFWYEAAALANCAELTLPGLHEESLQGDAILPELFKPIGVETVFGQEGAVLVKTQGTGHRAQGTGHRAQGTGHRAQGTGHGAQGTGYRAQGTGDRTHMAAGSLQKNDRKSTTGARLGQAEPIELVENHIDLGAYPDLAPSLIVTYAALGIAARFTGLHHLKIKESDRLQSLITELKRLNVFIRHPASGIIETDASQSIELTPGNCPPVTIETYSDHRIAMAFALLSTRTGSIRISDPAVVAKSYPGFWKELERLGFEICET